MPIDENSRQSLIAQVRAFWVEGVLGKSLYREAWSALGLYVDPKAVTYAGQLASIKREREPQPLPADVTIDRVFDDAQHRLLILGAPGGGKTTLLLELAKTLLDRAAPDKEQAIPVVFNLSSWAQQRQSLDKWLVQELRTNYGVGKNLARQWVQKNAILPLLDGLDEVAEPHRAACVNMINAYCAEHGPEGIVVCSRIADYRAIGAKLELNEAVVVQPLTDRQIDDYFDQAGTPLAGVRAVLAQDAELQKLVRVPLMLNIISLAYHDERPEELHGIPPQEQRHRLFERYVLRMLERPRKLEQLGADTPAYPHDKTKRWLGWLAGRLQENNLTVFEMERMQPWWLGRWWQRGLYVLFSTLFIMAGGLLLGPLFGLLLGLVVGLGLEGVLRLGFEATLRQGDVLNVTLAVGLIVGLISGLGGGLLIGLLVSIGQRSLPRRCRWHAWIAGLIVTGLSILPLWMSSGIIGLALLLWALFSAVPLGLAVAALVQCGEVRPTESVHWSWRTVRARWYLMPVVGLVGLVATSVFVMGAGMVVGRGSKLDVEELVASLFPPLVADLILDLLIRFDTGLANIIFVSLVVGLRSILGSGLVLGLVAALSFTLVAGLTSADILVKQWPNVSTWRSLRLALVTWMLMELLLGLVGGLVLGLGLGLVSGQVFGLALGLTFGLVSGLISGPATGLYFGGLAFVQHFALRLVYALSSFAPWNYPRFLNYATDRILLRRVGGSYIFVHRMLLEYFAGIDTDEPQPVASEMRKSAANTPTLQQSFDINVLMNSKTQSPSPTQTIPETTHHNTHHLQEERMPFTNGHALIIGVGADLPTTIDDALGLADIVRDPARCAYPPDRVQVLTGEQANRAQILVALDRLVQATDAQSTVIVYFSGHGYRVTSSSSEAYYLIPFDCDITQLSQTAISGDEFASRLRAIPAQKLVLLLDCCHAGGVGEAKGMTLAKAPLPPEAQQMLADGRGWVLIASSREDELSYAGTPYSAFTLALIEALCGTGVATQDGYVRVADLALHTRQMVPERTHDKQHPILHFEQADNFALAYYAGSATQPKELPFSGEPQIEPAPGTLDRERRQQLVSGAGAVGIVGNVRNSPITTGSGNTVISTGDIGDSAGQVAVGSNIAQSSDGSAHVDNSRSVFDQRGQKVGGSQYNAARDMTIGREQQEPRRPLSDRRLAQVVQVALERYSLDDVLFNLGSYTDLGVNTDTLGADAAAQARNLVTQCRAKQQRTALVTSLRDFEDGLLGTPDDEEAWLAWAREVDSR